jgi:hypothetical protein
MLGQQEVLLTQVDLETRMMTAGDITHTVLLDLHECPNRPTVI